MKKSIFARFALAIVVVVIYCTFRSCSPPIHDAEWPLLLIGVHVWVTRIVDEQLSNFSFCLQAPDTISISGWLVHIFRRRYHCRRRHLLKLKKSFDKISRNQCSSCLDDHKPTESRSTKTYGLLLKLREKLPVADKSIEQTNSFDPHSGTNEGHTNGNERCHQLPQPTPKIKHPESYSGFTNFVLSNSSEFRKL